MLIYGFKAMASISAKTPGGNVFTVLMVQTIGSIERNS